MRSQPPYLDLRHSLLQGGVGRPFALVKLSACSLSTAQIIQSSTGPDPLKTARSGLDDAGQNDDLEGTTGRDLSFHCLRSIQSVAAKTQEVIELAGP